MKSLRAIRCSRLDHIRNKTRLDEPELHSVLDYVERAQLRWYWHIKRMVPERYPRRYYEWRPTGKRPVGRPRMRWWTNIERAIEKRSTTMEEVERTNGYEDRTQWRRFLWRNN
ncbi:uncharacterized protein LOC143039078 [Oratosquilla oratoria]|uniref:uncharacterized protein LOC143039078 n=1 Tax=Oratosquilla oratoria TaxID=337810 RepID=UPI003F76C161